jgi:hypothetical protein
MKFLFISTSFNNFISNLNAVLFFVGFPLFTTLFYGSEMQTQTSQLTISYRIFTFVIAVIVICLNNRIPRFNNLGKLFLFFWFAYLIRIIYDLYFRIDAFYIPPFQKLQHLNTSIVSSFFPLMALFFSHKKLNLEKIFIVISFFLLFSTVYGIFSQKPDTLGNIRARLNIAENTLSFGFYSASTVIAGLTLFYLGDLTKKISKIISVIMMIVGIIGVGVAGSRGPFAGMLLAIILPLIYKAKAKELLIIFIVFTGILIFNQAILNFFYSNFPVLFERTLSTVVEGDTSGRGSIFSDAIAQITAHPIIGDWHLLYYKNGIGNFAHNIILDSWMSLGIILGSLIIVLYIYFIKQAIKLISAKNSYSFIGYLTLLSIGYSLTTGGALPYKDTFNFAFGLLIITMLPYYKIRSLTNKNK